jgi:hypothetical protein
MNGIDEVQYSMHGFSNDGSPSTYEFSSTHTLKDQVKTLKFKQFIECNHEIHLVGTDSNDILQVVPAVNCKIVKKEEKQPLLG